MILALEILLTISAIYMLATGKPLLTGKKGAPKPNKDWRFRVLGGFLLTFWIVAIVAGIAAAVVYAMKHPDLAPEQFEQQFTADFKWWGIAIEAGIVLAYTAIAIIATSMIAKRQNLPEPTPAFSETFKP